MKTLSNVLLALLFVVVVAMTGCLKIDVSTSSPPPPADPIYVPLLPPGGGGSSGQIVTPVPSGDTIVFNVTNILAYPGGNDCFMTNNGWNGYLRIARRFEGPFSTSQPGVYTNSGHFPNLVVKTCNSLNSTNLETGISIFDLSVGNFVVCATTNCVLMNFKNLATVLAPMQSNTLYEATIYLRTNTLYTLTNTITVDWNYQ